MRSLKSLSVLAISIAWLFHLVGHESNMAHTTSLVQTSPAVQTGCSDTDQVLRTACDCQAEADQNQPVSGLDIEDRELLAKVSREGQRLVEAGDVTQMGILMKQLQLDRCQLDLPPPSLLASSPSDIYLKAKPSIVVVAGLYLCDKCDKWHASIASGFVIADSGAIVTNYHVVNSEKKRTLIVVTADGYLLPVQRILAASERDDLAIVKVSADNLIPLTIAADDDAAPIGAPVSVISHPAHHFYYFSSGVVSRYTNVLTPRGRSRRFAITADYARGSSGAPVLNDRGQVVGIVKSTESIYYSRVNGQAQNLQMVFKHCIPAKNLLKLISS